MSTVTDHLLADLIAHIYMPDKYPNNRDEARVKYAAECLALAEQQSTPDRVEARLAALEANSHKPIDLGPAIVEILGELGIKAPVPAEPPRADWVEAATEHTISARPSTITALEARMVLDAFIAAMPKGGAQVNGEVVGALADAAGLFETDAVSRVTEEMVEALRTELQNWGCPASRNVATYALEAVLAAAPKVKAARDYLNLPKDQTP